MYFHNSEVDILKVENKKYLYMITCSNWYNGFSVVEIGNE